MNYQGGPLMQSQAGFFCLFLYQRGSFDKRRRGEGHDDRGRGRSGAVTSQGMPAATRSHKRQHLDFGPVILVSFFCPPEPSENPFLSFRATLFVLICYSGPRKLKQTLNLPFMQKSGGTFKGGYGTMPISCLNHILELSSQLNPKSERFLWNTQDT